MFQSFKNRHTCYFTYFGKNSLEFTEKKNICFKKHNMYKYTNKILVFFLPINSN